MCDVGLSLDVQKKKQVKWFSIETFKQNFSLFVSREAPCPGNEYTISTVCGVAAAAVVLLVLIAIITYKLTKQFVQKELLKSLSQSLDSSPITCEVKCILCLNSLAACACRL